MPLGRRLHGIALLAWLGPQYLACLTLTRHWRRPGRAWRRGLDRHGARMAAAYIRRHGGLLIKIGQFVATRPDLFPLTYVDACAPLRDQAPPRPWPIIAAALDEAYEGRTADRLARIEETALAAASFGQVHRAWLHDGTPVAVKVQYPDLAAAVATDLGVLRLALRLFSVALPGWPLAMIHDEIARTAREEQDYLHEGTAADRLRPVLEGAGLAVPTVVWEHTREKVLVTAFIAGETLARLDPATLPSDERRRIADTIIDGFLAMLLDVGFFHADPHGGNLIYERRDEAPARIWLIDFGMTAAMTPRESELYRRFLACLKRNDTDGMVDVLTSLGFVLPNADRARLRALAREVYDSLGHLNPRTFAGSLRQADLAAKINEFLRRVDGIVFPQHTLMLSRATSLIEGLCMDLVPSANVLDLIRPRLAKVSWRAQVRRVVEEVREVWQRLRSLPDRLEAAVKPPRRAHRELVPVLAALLLLAALQLDPSTARTVAAVAAGCAALCSLGRLR
ncbi:MAG: AarF/ABC1/UbiB kinase family protein [Planctomycetes bacterium]|nr:AarF/ABC1/UbiB kinase family protein [Planctomycetota bacterium]